MGWNEEGLKVLDAKFGTKTFTAEDAVKLLSKEKGFSAGTTYRLIHDLVGKGKLAKLGRGFYRFPRKIKISLSDTVKLSESTSTMLVHDVDEIAKRALLAKGIKFMITGPSLLYTFVHHFPRKMIHLIYVTKGGGENAMEALKEADLRCLLRPSRDEINLALNEFPERDLFVIRESLDIEGETNGIALLERALVDTYFETTRRRIPLSPEEFGRMTSNVFATRKVSISRLLLLAGRRGIRAEIRTILERLLPGLDLPGAHVRNVHVKSVLAGIASEER
jgi:hypothetical protein